MSCGCGDTNRITIVRGNDTNFNGQNFVHLNITSDVWDLSTMKATIALGGITKTFEDLSNGIDLSYTAAETSKMPFGDINGVLKVYNQEEQIATIESLLPFRVISVVHGNAIAVTPAEFNIEVKQGGETVMNIDVEAGVTVQVGTTTTLPAGSDATVTNSGTANHLVLNFGIPQGEKGEQGEQGEQGPVGPDGKDAKINGVNTLTLTATDGLVLSQSGNVATLSGKAIQDSVTTEATNRQSADNNLQQQIDAITASSDVTDIVGTYAELQAYDTTGLAPNSIIKVLQDENRNDETTYYRWVITGGVGSWVLIGEEGPYYTKSEADGKFVPQTRTVNGKALSANITLNAGDVGAATSAQGAKADTALQPSAIANMVTTNTEQQITAKKTTTAPFVLQNGLEVGGLIIGADAGTNTLTDNTRKMFRMLSPTNEDSDFYCADIAFDTVAQEGGGTKNSVSIGGRKGDPSNTAPDEFNILLATAHNATASNQKVVAYRMTKDGADFRVQPSYNGTNLVTSTDIANMVTTNTAQKITGEKTITTALNITGSGDNNALRLSEGTRINVFGTTKTILGFTGIGGNQYRFLINHGSYELMLRGLNARPYYNDTNTTLALSSDVPTTPADIGAEPATTVVALADASTITLASNTIYNGGTLTALTIQLPSGVDNAFTSEIDFTSGATATTFSYPNTLKWIEGDDVESQVFTPDVNKRYICMIIWDGTQYVGTVRGVE